MTRTLTLIAAATAASLAAAAPAMAAEDPMKDDGSVTATPMRPSVAKTAAEVAAEADSPGRDAVSDYLKTVHGEATAMVDSRGGYNVSGTAVLPLGENGTAIISMSRGSGPSAWRNGGHYPPGFYPPGFYPSGWYR